MINRLGIAIMVLFSLTESSPGTDSLMREQVNEIINSCRHEPPKGTVPLVVGACVTGCGIAWFGMGLMLQNEAKRMGGDGQPFPMLFGLTGSALKVLGVLFGVSGMPFITIGIYQRHRYQQWKDFCTKLSLHVDF